MAMDRFQLHYTPSSCHLSSVKEREKETICWPKSTDIRQEKWIDTFLAIIPLVSDLKKLYNAWEDELTWVDKRKLENRIQKELNLEPNPRVRRDLHITLFLLAAYKEWSNLQDYHGAPGSDVEVQCFSGRSDSDIFSITVIIQSHMNEIRDVSKMKVSANFSSPPTTPKPLKLRARVKPKRLTTAPATAELIREIQKDLKRKATESPEPQPQTPSPDYPNHNLLPESLRTTIQQAISGIFQDIMAGGDAAFKLKAGEGEAITSEETESSDDDTIIGSPGRGLPTPEGDEEDNNSNGNNAMGRLSDAEQDFSSSSSASSSGSGDDFICSFRNVQEILADVDVTLFEGEALEDEEMATMMSSTTTPTPIASATAAEAEVESAEE